MQINEHQRHFADNAYTILGSNSTHIYCMRVACAMKVASSNIVYIKHIFQEVFEKFTKYTPKFQFSNRRINSMYLECIWPPLIYWIHFTEKSHVECVNKMKLNSIDVDGNRLYMERCPYSESYDSYPYSICLLNIFRSIFYKI